MTKDTWLFIINPVGGNGSVSKQWSRFEDLLVKSNISFQLEWTDYAGHAIQLVQDKIKEGYRNFVAVGGDGTANEVVNGIYFQNSIAPDEILFTLLPIGTGNDWRRSWAIPKDFGAWLSMLEVENIKKQDVGLVDLKNGNDTQKRYFINVAGMAYDAFVVRYSEDHKLLINNRFFYLYMVLKCLFKFKLPKATIQFNGHTITDNFYTINLGICKYSGGGMQLVPHAVPDDGNFALTYVGKVPKWYIIVNTWRFYNGSITKLKKIKSNSIEQLKLSTPEDSKIGIEVDGEFVGNGPAEFSLIKKGLQIVVP